MQSSREVERAYKRIKLSLVEAQESRNLLPCSSDSEPYWSTYEVLVVWREVNLWRDLKDRIALNYSDIDSIERSAAGHSDYTHKFAWRAAELAVKD